MSAIVDQLRQAVLDLGQVAWSRSDTHQVNWFSALADEAADRIEELERAWDNAPILSKYHGQRGFETERFINDYREWRDKYRAALALAGEK